MNSDHKVTVYTMNHCPYCVRAKRLLAERGIPFEEQLVEEEDDSQWEALYKRSGMRTMPQIFAGEKLIGGYTELAKLDGEDHLDSLKQK